MGEKKRKRASESTVDEIFPGGGRHMPLRDEPRNHMDAILQAVASVFGKDYNITVFLHEKRPASPGELPRFNYGSTGHRADMIAVLEGFLAKQKAQAATLDRIEDEPQGGVQ